MPDEYPAEQRLGSDLAPEPVYQPPTYSQPREGHGSWCVLYGEGGTVVLGTLWTSDAGGLGFIPAGDSGVQRVPEFYMAFARAAAAGTPARVVFDQYAGMAGLGLSAGQVENGPLDTLDG